MRFKDLWKLYKWICKNPRSQFMQCVKAMDWSIPKTSKYIKQLERDGVIKAKYEEMKDHHHYEFTWYYYPTPAEELLNPL